jgi:nitrogen-specific signal transduction histidine kinase
MNLVMSERLESIFDAFATTKPQGTGLGLPIARTKRERPSIAKHTLGTAEAEERLMKPSG